MVKFVIKGEEKEEEPVLRVWLRVDSDGNLRLVASEEQDGWSYLIAYIDHNDGMLHIDKRCDVNSLTTDDTGRIVVAGYTRVE